MKDNVFFLVCQVFERHVCPYAHRPADILHQRPHQCVPWCDRTFIYGKVPVRDECGTVNGADGPGAVAGPACSLTVECQVFGSGRIEMFPAYGADKIFSCSDPQ